MSFIFSLFSFATFDICPSRKENKFREVLNKDSVTKIGSAELAVFEST